MEESEFDKFADEYRALLGRSIKASGESPDYYVEYKVRDLVRACRRISGGPPNRVLDFGAGIGSSIPFFQKYTPKTEVTCLDVSRKSLDVGSTRFGSHAGFVHFDGKTMPFPDGSFDVFFAACVLHHIPGAEHANILSEALRVLRGGGVAFIYEHNPRNPLTVRAVNDCPFDENATLIAGPKAVKALKETGFSDVALRYRVFFPRALRVLRPLERGLTRIPLGAQYYVVGQK